MSDKDLYKSTIESNLLFGGIKIFQVLVTLLKTKIIALLLGPGGMGIQYLFTSTLSSLHQFTTFGIFQSAVRDISKVNTPQEEEKKNAVIKVLNTLVFIVGILGCVICIIFSNILSRLVFGNGDYRFAFVLVSFALIFEAFSNGIITTLQGLRKLRELANGSLIGALASLVISIPLYLLWNIKAIPFAIVLGYFIVFVVYRFYSKEVALLKQVHFATYKGLQSIGIPIVKLGTILMLSNGIMTLFSLILNAYINRLNGIADVGYYQAASACTYGNITILLSILASDFYPRLSASLNKPNELNVIVNQQVEFLVLIVAPIVCAVILFSKLVVRVLLSAEFVVIIPMLQLMALSLIFRVVWHALSFIILAHGDKRSYLIYDAIIGNGSVFIMNIIGYYFGGLQGLSISYVIGAIGMVVLLRIIIPFKYNVKLNKSFWKTFVLFLLLIITAYIIVSVVKGAAMWILSYILICIILGISIHILNKRINIRSFFKWT